MKSWAKLLGAWRKNKRRKPNAFQIARSPPGSTIPLVCVAERLRQRMMIRAENTQIIGAIVRGISVDVIHVQWYSTRSRIALTPTAKAAFEAGRLEQISPNTHRRSLAGAF